MEKKHVKQEETEKQKETDKQKETYKTIRNTQNKRKHA